MKRLLQRLLALVPELSTVKIESSLLRVPSEEKLVPPQVVPHHDKCADVLLADLLASVGLFDLGKCEECRSSKLKLVKTGTEHSKSRTAQEKAKERVSSKNGATTLKWLTNTTDPAMEPKGHIQGYALRSLPFRSEKIDTERMNGAWCMINDDPIFLIFHNVGVYFHIHSRAEWSKLYSEQIKSSQNLN